MNCQVKAKNKRGYIQEELFSTYGEALDHSLECLNSNQYSVITINLWCTINNNYFLMKIIK